MVIRWHPWHSRENGSVTVEAALALSAIVLVMALCLAGLGAMVATARVTDAAGEAARLAARGDDAGARRAVAALAPDGSTLELTGLELTGEEWVTATVVAPTWGSLLPGLGVSAVAIAAREPVDAGP